MNKYLCKCIAPGCSFFISVEAENMIEAVEKMLEKGDSHYFENHPDMPVLSDKKIKECIRKNIRKVD